jgi:hypothetical protein
MAKKVDSFAVLSRMCDLNRDIRLATGENLLNLKKVKAGTQVTFGVSGDVVGAIYTGKLQARLFLYDTEQFKATEAEMEAEAKP